MDGVEGSGKFPCLSHDIGRRAAPRRSDGRCEDASPAIDDSDGQLRMAERYQLGKGVPLDLAKARELYQAAAAQGNRDASAALKTLGWTATTNAAPPPPN